MADFYYFLNRQGIRGLQGVKGDQGDSPIITVQTETPNEYILKITNPDGTELISPNLRGNKININEGTYVRYNTDTGELYTSTADGATGELAGIVRLATDADVTNMDERAAVTPSQLADALSQYLVSPDGSVKIVQNENSSLTELTAEKGLTELPIASANTLGAVKIGENLSITEDGVLSSTASGDVSGSGDNTFTGTNNFNGEVNLNGLTTAENLTVARNLTSSGEINAVSIKSTGIRSDDIKTTTNKKYLTEEDVDNSTIKVVDGKLSVNDDNYIKTSQVSKGGLSCGVYLNSSKANSLDTVQPIFTAFDGALGTDDISYLKAATYSASEPADEDMVNNWTNKEGYLTGVTSSTGFIDGIVKFNAGSGSSQVVFKLMETGNISGIDQKGRYKFSKIEISTDGVTYTEYNNTISEAKYIRFTFDYNFTIPTSVLLSTRIRTVVSNIAGGESRPLSVKVDNSTIQIVDDKLHVNFDEINGEISDVSSRVVTLEGQVESISTTLNSNIADTENLKETKNNNIFDIGKFTVVGSPTITDDGVASGFSGTDYITCINPSLWANASNWHLSWVQYCDFNTSVGSIFIYLGDFSYGYFGYNSEWNSITLNCYDINNSQIFISVEGVRSKFVAGNLKFDVYYSDQTGYYFTVSQGDKIYTSIKSTNTNKLRHSTSNLVKFNAIPVDLKQLSITVDGQEVFNGLMNSTKPIYDKITTLNTNVSDFELETSNNFSAVNSALNEKANLSDLSKCASLADFNRLSATVTALESQVGDVSAVLDNINGEVV